MKAPPVVKRPSCYVAGPMRGIDCFNFPAFDEAAAYLRSEGWDVRSPAEHDRSEGFDETKNTLDGFDLGSAIFWDLQQVAEVEVVIVLPGWETSSGVALELHMARFLDKDVLYYNPKGPQGCRLLDVPVSTKVEVGKIDVAEQLLAELEKPIWGSPDGSLDYETRITNAETGGQKGQKLARFDLLPARPLRLLAEHYGRGAQKYEDRNWERGYDWSLTFAALQRHAWAAWGGEDIDPETGSPHMVAVAWHALAWLEFMETHPEMDDRPCSSSR